MLNFEDVEERDGLLSVLVHDKALTLVTLRRSSLLECVAIVPHRGHQNRGPNIGSLYTSQSPRRPSSSPLRTRCMQTALSRNSQPLLVCTCSKISTIHC